MTIDSCLFRSFFSKFELKEKMESAYDQGGVGCIDFGFIEDSVRFL